MSDSGIPPSRPQVPAPPSPAKPDGVPARIENATGALQILSRALQIAGTVVGHNGDGSVTIQTPQGDLTVQLRGGTDLANGQTVTIDIAAGRPPRQAVIRPDDSAPEQTQTPQLPPDQTQPSPAPPNDGATQTTPPPAPPSRSITLSPAVAEQAQGPPPPAATPPPANLAPGDVVRLVPLTPQQALQIIAQPDAAPALETALTRRAAADVFSAIVIEIKPPDAGETLLQKALPQIPAATPQPSTADSMPPAPFSPVRIPPLPRLPMPFPPLALLAGIQAPHDPAVPAPVRVPAAQLFLAPLSAPPPEAGNAPLPLPLRLAPPQAPVTAAPLPFLSRTQTPPPARLTLLPVQIPLPAPDAATLTPKTMPPPVSRPPFLDVRMIRIEPEPVQIVPPPQAAPPDEKAVQSPAPILQATRNPFLFRSLRPPDALQTAAPKAAFPQPEPQPLPPGPAGSQNVAVVGFTPGKNQPVIALSPPGQPEQAQLFSLQAAPANLKMGSLLIFLPHRAEAAAYESPVREPIDAPAATPAYELLNDFSWPALAALPQVLTQAAAAPQAQAAVMQTLSHAVPNPATPQQVPPAALFFLAAVRSGDITDWLGEKATGLLSAAGRGDLIDRLSRDAAGLQKTDAPPAPGQDWRSLALPLFWENDMRKLLLHYRRSGDEPGDGSGGQKKPGTRFLFEMSLSRMGTIQLDGLHRPPKRLDLIVRTQATLSADMKQAMRGVWLRALEQTELAGEISFQHRPEQFVKVESARPQAGISA